MKRTCKICEKPLIGKEKLFCNNCWAKGKDKAKNGALGALGLASLVILAITQKDKLTDIFKDTTDI
jgi:hypothetical protein